MDKRYGTPVMRGTKDKVPHRGAWVIVFGAAAWALLATIAMGAV